MFRDICLNMLERAELSGEQKKDAEELAAALRLFVPISPSLIPETSLLREFLGAQGLEKTD